MILGRHSSKARQRLAEICRLADAEIDLGEAALLIAAEEYPDLDVGAWLTRLDALASDARPRLEGAHGEFERLRGLLDFLYVDYGLSGNAEDYYDPRNSYLNEVLERRVGIPITLSVVAIEVGRRVGIPLRGVGFPGHFLVSHVCHPEVVLDPFDGGRFLTAAECEELLRELSGGRIRFHPRLLRTVSRREILQRMLHNLRGIYLDRHDVPRTLGVLDRLVLLDPENWLYRRDRGLLLLACGDLEGAVEDLESYLGGEPEAPDRDEVAQVIREARGKLEKIH